MADLEPGQARMRHPDPAIPDQTVYASQVPHLELSGYQFVEGDREEWPAEALPFGGQPVVRIYHPELEAYHEVAESAVPYHRERGWVLVEDEAEAEAQAGLEGKTVPELRELAKNQGITPIPTTKPELLAALTKQPSEDQAAEAAQDQEEEA